MVNREIGYDLNTIFYTYFVLYLVLHLLNHKNVKYFESITLLLYICKYNIIIGNTGDLMGNRS